MWQKDVAEYCRTCDRFQKANKYTGKRLGNMMKIQELRKPWETVHMDWVTGLPPGGDRSYNACQVIADRFSKTPIFLPCHKDDTAMDTALLIWDRVISCTSIISDRDPKFTSALWTNIHQLFGTKLSFSTAYHPQTDGLAEIVIQTLEDMARRFCAYGFNLKIVMGSPMIGVLSYQHWNWHTKHPFMPVPIKLLYSREGMESQITPRFIEEGFG
ncbi:hypothetical protein O181_027477 [Austropuccinia psidii MF-1]|uniref:Integrase catalytic domain-containing protein n=1 Tax=Austropuccinia psidii MF-1 TaxID=1389203 RepID=A0A9Q3CQ40_9BASI|nr:hypothetical protein [Austropuccinia psidii MF-1]